MYMQTKRAAARAAKAVEARAHFARGMESSTPLRIQMILHDMNMQLSMGLRISAGHDGFKIARNEFGIKAVGKENVYREFMRMLALALYG